MLANLPPAAVAALDRLQAVPERHDACVTHFRVGENQQPSVAVELAQASRAWTRRPYRPWRSRRARRRGRSSRSRARGQAMRARRRAGAKLAERAPGRGRSRARRTRRCASRHAGRAASSRIRPRVSREHTAPAVLAGVLLDEPGADERRGLAGEGRAIHGEAGGQVPDRHGPLHLQPGEDRVLRRAEAVRLPPGRTGARRPSSSCGGWRRRRGTRRDRRRAHRNRVYPPIWQARAWAAGALRLGGRRGRLRRPRHVGGLRSTGRLLIPLHDEFGWSHETIGLAVSLNLLCFGLGAPFAAAFVERFGMRGSSPAPSPSSPSRRS